MGIENAQTATETDADNFYGWELHNVRKHFHMELRLLHDFFSVLFGLTSAITTVRHAG